MSVTRILVDTNVLIDDITSREPFYGVSHAVMKLCKDKAVEGFAAAHSITDAFYILRTNFSLQERRKVILGLCKVLTVVALLYHASIL